MENQIEIFKTLDGTTQVEVRFEGDTFWLSQVQLSILFDRDQSVISRHISTIFKNGELEREGNMQKMHIPNSDKPITLFNLDVIISVGYRVNSIRGTQFRQWATKRLKDFLIDGVALNEKRLAQKKKLEIHHLPLNIVIPIIPSVL